MSAHVKELIRKVSGVVYHPITGFAPVLMASETIDDVGEKRNPEACSFEPADQAESSDEEESEAGQDLQRHEDLAQERPDLEAERVERAKQDEGRQNDDTEKNALPRVPPDDLPARGKQCNQRQRAEVGEEDQESLLIRERLGYGRLPAQRFAVQIFFFQSAPVIGLHRMSL